MGLFSSKKKIYVSSVVYNLAGPLSERRSFLKTTVVREVLNTDPNRYIGSALVRQQLNGPAFQQRDFFRWAKRNYPSGLLTGQISNKMPVSADAVRRFIPVPADRSLTIQAAQIDSGDFMYWVEKFLMENRLSRYNEDWVADYNSATNTATIQYPDTTSEDVVLTGYAPNAFYIFAYYSLAERDTDGTLVTGEMFIEQPSLPNMTGYTLLTTRPFTQQIPVTDTVTTVTRTNGGAPVTSVQSTPRILTFNGVEQTHTRSERYSPNPAEIRVLEDVYNRWSRSRPVLSGSINTTVTDDGNGTVTTTTTLTHSILPRWDYRTNINQGAVISDNLEEPRMFIYHIGSGNNTLDALMTSQWEEPEFYPIIPLRIDNRSVRDPVYEVPMRTWSKAYRKATGASIDDILDTVEDNPNLGDIDYAYLVHGVELNTEEKEGKQYLYEFLSQLILHQGNAVTNFNTWLNTELPSQEDYNAQLRAWEWDQEFYGPLYGTPRPTMQTRQAPPVQSIDIRSPGESGFNFWFRLSWLAIDENIGAGLGRAGAQRGDLWWEVVSTGGTVFSQIPLFTREPGDPWVQPDVRFDHVRLYWQTSDTAYKYLDIHGMTHENVIYGSNSVEIKASEALGDEEESGFIIPLHEPSVRKLGVVAANELCLSSRQIVFNCYLVRRIRWYQRFVFKIIIAAVLSVIFMPAGVGLLGANAAVGASLGLTGAAALFAGAVANSIAAVVLSMVIQTGATAVFGDKLGTIIGAIATAFTFSYISNFHVTGSWSFNWSDMLKVDNLLKLTDSVAGSMQNWASAEMQGINEESTRAADTFEQSSREIEKKRQELFGYSGAALDPLMFTQMQDSSLRSVESSSTFLTRTLLTGSEIADLSLSMIGSFPELSLRLPTAFE